MKKTVKLTMFVVILIFLVSTCIMLTAYAAAAENDQSVKDDSAGARLSDESDKVGTEPAATTSDKLPEVASAGDDGSADKDKAKDVAPNGIEGMMSGLMDSIGKTAGKDGKDGKDGDDMASMNKMLGVLSATMAMGMLGMVMKESKSMMGSLTGALGGSATKTLGLDGVFGNDSATKSLGLDGALAGDANKTLGMDSLFGKDALGLDNATGAAEADDTSTKDAATKDPTVADAETKESAAADAGTTEPAAAEETSATPDTTKDVEASPEAQASNVGETPEVEETDTPAAPL